MLSRNTAATLVVWLLITVAWTFVAVMAGAFVLHRPETTPFYTPEGLADPSFAKIGRAYAPQLVATYAKALKAAAKSIDNGVPISDTLKVVEPQWDSLRAAQFDLAVTPALSKVLPESRKDSDVTPAQRSALASAIRGLAVGLEQSR